MLVLGSDTQKTNETIVESWRFKDWKEEDTSTVTITIKEKTSDTGALTVQIAFLHSGDVFLITCAGFPVVCA